MVVSVYRYEGSVYQGRMCKVWKGEWKKSAAVRKIVFATNCALIRRQLNFRPKAIDKKANSSVSFKFQ